MDHAGELGADRIYAGQMAVLGHTAEGPLIQHMWDQEIKHREKFEELINKYRVRPTIMTPIWNIAGFALGAGKFSFGHSSLLLFRAQWSSLSRMISNSIPRLGAITYTNDSHIYPCLSQLQSK